MEYTLLLYESGSEFARRGEDPETSSYWGAWYAYGKAMKEAGITKGEGNALQPPDTATVVRIEDGNRRVQDGPFADAKEQLGGYIVIDVPNLDAALEWAARAPCAANGCVEVRPVLAMDED